jgi:hypothetical protein
VKVQQLAHAESIEFKVLAFWQGLLIGFKNGRRGKENERLQLRRLGV